jgi:hypothetical protein
LVWYILAKEGDDGKGDVIAYEKEIVDALKIFQKLTEVGNQSRKYNLYKVYPELIQKEANALKAKQKKENYLPFLHKQLWLEEYIRQMKKAYITHSKSPSTPVRVYRLESAILSGATKKFIREGKFLSLKSYFKSLLSGC